MLKLLAILEDYDVRELLELEVLLGGGEVVDIDLVGVGGGGVLLGAMSPEIGSPIATHQRAKRTARFEAAKPQQAGCAVPRCLLYPKCTGHYRVARA